MKMSQVTIVEILNENDLWYSIYRGDKELAAAPSCFLTVISVY